MMNKPTVTVVIPMFNNQHSICETLDSVVSQTMKDWEVVCVDDGSTDNSVEVVELYISRHRDYSIRIIRRESKNKGGSVCRNIGAKAANGNYLVFLDADDLLAPSCLEKRVVVMKEEKLQFAVFPMASYVNNDLSTARMYSRLNVREPLYFFSSGLGTWQVTSPIIRKTFFDNLGGFDESFPRLQDIEFHIRAIIESNGNYAVMKENAADCYYRQGGSNEVKVEKLKRTIAGCQKLIQLLEGYANQGIFENKNKFSLSLLSLFCHLSIYQDWIIESNSEYNRWNPVLDSGLKNYLFNSTFMIIQAIDQIPNVKLRLIASRVVDKIARKKLAK